MRNFCTTPKFDSVSRECSWVAVTSRVNYSQITFCFVSFFLLHLPFCLCFCREGLRFEFWRKNTGRNIKAALQNIYFAIKETKIFVVFFEQNFLAESKALCNVFLIFQWVRKKSKYSLPLRALKSSTAVGGETQSFTLPHSRGFRGGVAIAWICKCMKVFGFLLCER